MPLPRQAQAQLDAANSIIAPPAPTPAPQPIEEPPAPVPAPVAQPAPPPAPAAAMPVPAENWEHKYKVLQGMFNQTNEQVRTLTARVQELTQQPPAPTPAPTAPPKPAVDPKDVEEFGLPLIEMVRRHVESFLAGAQQQIEHQFGLVIQRIDALERQVQGTSKELTRTAEDMFFDRLDEICRQANFDWEQVNQSEGFQAYLSQRDPVYDLTQNDALQDARRRLDAARAAEIFKRYVASLPPPVVSPPVESPSPRSAGSAPPPPAPQKQLIAASEVDNFYMRVRKGEFRHNPAEKARLEALYNAALAEGRIV